MRRFVEAGRRIGDLVVLKDDDHHLSSTAGRQLTLDSLFAFLDRWLPVGS